MIDGEVATHNDRRLERPPASTRCDENTGRAAFQRRIPPPSRKHCAASPSQKANRRPIRNLIAYPATRPRTAQCIAETANCPSPRRLVRSPRINTWSAPRLANTTRTQRIGHATMHTARGKSSRGPENTWRSVPLSFQPPSRHTTRRARRTTQSIKPASYIDDDRHGRESGVARRSLDGWRHGVAPITTTTATPTEQTGAIPHGERRRTAAIYRPAIGKPQHTSILPHREKASNSEHFPSAAHPRRLKRPDTRCEPRRRRRAVVDRRYAPARCGEARYRYSDSTSSDPPPPLR